MKNIQKSDDIYSAPYNYIKQCRRGPGTVVIILALWRNVTSDQFNGQPSMIRESKMHNVSYWQPHVTFQLHSEDQVWPQHLEVDANLDRLILQSRDHWLGDWVCTRAHTCISAVLVQIWCHVSLGLDSYCMCVTMVTLMGGWEMRAQWGMEVNMSLNLQRLKRSTTLPDNEMKCKTVYLGDQKMNFGI